MKLRWEASDPKYPDFQRGYHCDIGVGLVYRRAGETKWHYQVEAVRTKWITKGSGEVSTQRGARRALIRAWKTWLEHAGLSPVTKPTVAHDRFVPPVDPSAPIPARA